jgi:hypothetical protein
MKNFLALLLFAAAAVYLYFASQPAPPPAHRYSADNIFYLRDYVSIRTQKGVVGLNPGQEVWLDANAAQVPGKVMVSDGHDTLPVDPDYLTHDMDAAASLQASDAQSQSALAAQIAQTKRIADLQEQSANSAMADGINASNALQVSANAVGNYRSQLVAPSTRTGSLSYYGGTVYVPTVVSAPGTTRASGSVLTSGAVYPAALPSASGANTAVFETRARSQAPITPATTMPAHPGTGTYGGAAVQ